MRLSLHVASCIEAMQLHSGCERGNSLFFVRMQASPGSRLVDDASFDAPPYGDDGGNRAQVRGGRSYDPGTHGWSTASAAAREA